MNIEHRHLQQGATLLLAGSAGLVAGFLLGRIPPLSQPAPSEGPLNKEALKKNWQQAVTFDAAGDGIIY